MFNITSRQPMYDQDAVQHMRNELVAVGFKELQSLTERLLQSLEPITGNEKNNKIIIVAYFMVFPDLL